MRAREWSMMRRHTRARQCCTEVLLLRAQALRGTHAAGPPGRERKCGRLSLAGAGAEESGRPQENFISSFLQKKSWCRGKCAKGKKDRELEGMPVSTWWKQGSTMRNIWRPLHITWIPGGAGQSHPANHWSTGSHQPTQPKRFKTQRKPRWVIKPIFNPRLFVPDSSLKW